MRVSTAVLRITPVILPLTAICSALAGLALRTGEFPEAGNLELVVIATLVSGILPICLLIGTILVIGDILWPSHEKIIITGAAVFALATSVACFYYGQGLYF
jgi:hypothetical protein